jgi:hypothetical protein
MGGIRDFGLHMSPDMKVKFRPDDMKFMTLKRHLSTKASMCKECGHIDLWGDVEALIAVLPAQ